MKFGLIIVGLIATLSFAVVWYGNPTPSTDNCFMSSSPHVVRQEASVLLQYWLVEDRPQFYKSRLPASSALLEFRERISESMKVAPFALLKGQLSYVTGGDAENVRLVLSGTVPVRPMNCLEAILLATQSERSTAQGRSMYTHPTEFLSYVLRRGDALKIWYYTVDQAGIGGLATLHEPLMADVQQGWVVVTNIHNHNFFPDAAKVLGGVAPSATDIQYLRDLRRSLGLTRAVITNGFHSIDISSADFDRFTGR
jgi:hypothetical protein